MQELQSIETVKQFISEHSLSFIYISRTNCGVCHALKPQIEELLTQYPNIHAASVNADHVEEIAGHFSIFTVPVMLFFIDGKEYIREARFVHVESLQEKLTKLYQMAND